MAFLMILYVGLGLLLALIAIPLILEQVRPNWAYGFRLRRTLENPQVWYAVNKYGGKRLLAAGLGMSLSAVLIYLVPGLDLQTYALTCLVVFSILLTVAMAQTMRYLNRITRPDAGGDR